jgi:hypothetical protein
VSFPRDVREVDVPIGGLQKHRVDLELCQILRQRIADRGFLEA